MATEDAKSAEEDNRPLVTVCGGGNGAHAFVVTVAAKFLPRYRVNWLSLYGDEASRINDKLSKNENYIKGIFTQENAIVSARPNVVTNDAAQAIPGTDILILCVPAFAHVQYLDAINTHHEVCNSKASKKLIVAAFPSACGLEFAFKKILRNVENIALFNCLTLPWACRIIEYGVGVEILGIKDSVGNYVYATDEFLKETNVLSRMNDIFLDSKPKLTCDYNVNVLSSSLGSMNPVIHNAIMYSQWSDYKTGQQLDEKPLFYQGITKQGSNLMSSLSEEVLSIANKYNELGLAKNSNFRKISFPHVKDWYEESYGSVCTDSSTLYGLIRTNPGYNGLTHPMKKSSEDGEKYVPDFGYRYLTEDIPFGLLVTKAMACILDDSGNGVKTDQLDKVLLWAEKAMKRKYFTVNEKTGSVAIDLESKDVAKARVPQVFGMKTVDDILTM